MRKKTYRFTAAWLCLLLLFCFGAAACSSREKSALIEGDYTEIDMENEGVTELYTEEDTEPLTEEHTEEPEGASALSGEEESTGLPEDFTMWSEDAE